MELTDSSAFFYTPEAILLRNLLTLSTILINIQKVLVHFNYGEVKEHGQNPLNALQLVKEVSQTYKGEREVSTQMKI